MAGLQDELDIGLLDIHLVNPVILSNSLESLCGKHSIMTRFLFLVSAAAADREAAGPFDLLIAY